MKIHFNPLLMKKIEYIVASFNLEIGGYLTGEIKEGEIYLDDLLIPNQKISVASVEITPQDQLELRQKYKDKVFKILGHFHSHNTMGAFWSGIDENNMSTIMKTKNIFVFMVSSYRGGEYEHKIRVSIRNPITLDINDIEVDVFGNEIQDLQNRINEIKNINAINTESHDAEDEFFNDFKVEEDDESIVMTKNIDNADDNESRIKHGSIWKSQQVYSILKEQDGRTLYTEELKYLIKDYYSHATRLEDIAVIQRHVKKIDKHLWKIAVHNGQY
jgi:proteasome lid subunit RPN8/RPN11